MTGAFSSNLLTGTIVSAGTEKLFQWRISQCIPGKVHWWDNKGKYVPKRYKEEKVNEIKELFGTTEAHTRKVIQMNVLARNFAQNLDRERPILDVYVFKGVHVLLIFQRGICDFRGLY